MDIENGSSVIPIEPTQPIKIFYCYAHADKRFQRMLEKYLSTMRRSNWISSWHYGMINAGNDWKSEVDEQIKVANVILLLISPDFMDSDYCWDVEMTYALERHKAKKACVIPIILRPTDWDDAPFSSLQVLPANGEPLIKWRNRDEAFLDISRGIRKAVRTLLISQKTEDQWIEEGNRFFCLGKFKDALTSYEYAIELAPYSAIAYYRKGTALWELGLYNEAIEFNEQALDIALKNVLPNSEDKENVTLRNLLEDTNTKANFSVFYKNKGKCLIILGRFKDAIAAFDQALDLAPLGEFYYMRGIAFMKLQCYAEALHDFDRAIYLAPDDEEIFVYYTQKGQALSSLGRTKDALNSYEQALTLNPNYHEALTANGMLLGQLKRFEDALVLFERAIQLYPNSIDSYLCKARTLYLMKDYESSIEAYKKAIKLDDNESFALCGMGKALYMLHRYNDALIAFEAAIQVDHENREAYLCKADVLKDMGHDLESLIVLNHIEHKYPASYDEVNYPFSDIDDPVKLLASCEQELQNNPQNTWVLIFKCFALMKLDQMQEAYDLYTYLLQNYPDIELGVQGSFFREFGIFFEQMVSNGTIT